jgi:hypothetical protein
MRVQGLRFNENRAILLDESHKLDQPMMAFRWGSTTKKWQIKAKLPLHDFQGKINWFGTPKEKTSKTSKGELTNFKEPRCKLVSKARPTHGFNLVQMSPKLVPRNLNPGPHLNWDSIPILASFSIYIFDILYLLWLDIWLDKTKNSGVLSTIK